MTIKQTRNGKHNILGSNKAGLVKESVMSRVRDVFQTCVRLITVLIHMKSDSIIMIRSVMLCSVIPINIDYYINIH